MLSTVVVAAGSSPSGDIQHLTSLVFPTLIACTTVLRISFWLGIGVGATYFCCGCGGCWCWSSAGGGIWGEATRGVAVVGGTSGGGGVVKIRGTCCGKGGGGGNLCCWGVIVSIIK